MFILMAQRMSRLGLSERQYELFNMLHCAVVIGPTPARKAEHETHEILSDVFVLSFLAAEGAA